MITIILALAGLLLSGYAFYAETRYKSDKNYYPVCDVNHKISCSDVFKSKYGHILGISNSLVGMIYYYFLMMFIAVEATILVQIISGVALICSIILGYLLFFKVKRICLVCNTIYLINAIIFILSII